MVIIMIRKKQLIFYCKLTLFLVYHCGSDLGWSELFTFTTIKEGSNWSPRLAVFGDMGNKNAQSLPRLQQETQRGHFDTILHVGDFAYDMDTVCYFFNFFLAFLYFKN